MARSKKTAPVAAKAPPPAAKEAAPPMKIKQPPVLFDQTQRIIGELGEALGGPLLAYWNNPRGEVCHNDVIALYAILEQLGKCKTIFLYVKSGGGSGQAAMRIVNLVRQYCQRLIVLVPL